MAYKLSSMSFFSSVIFFKLPITSVFDVLKNKKNKLLLKILVYLWTESLQVTT